MKRTTIIFMALIAAASCQEVVMEAPQDAAISISLKNSPVVETVTKADGASDEVSTDDFNVYVSGTNDGGSFSKTYIYGQMPNVVEVAAGTYKVAADNVTEAAALEGWGQVRYFGQTEEKSVVAGAVTPFSLTCAMVNTAVSVAFVGEFSNYFTDYKVTVYVEDNDSRKLEYTSESGIGYFNPSAALVYAFTGIRTDGTAYAAIQGRIANGSEQFKPATHLTLNFKVKGQTGVGKPTIEVNTECTPVTEDVTVDPTEDLTEDLNDNN